MRDFASVLKSGYTIRMSGRQGSWSLKAIQIIRWRKFIDAMWMILFVTAVGTLLLSLPGYARFISNGQSNPVNAPSIYIKTMQLASMLASMATACLSLGLAVILFRRKRAEAMAVFISFFLLGYGIIVAGPLEALYAAHSGEFTSRIYAIQSVLFTTPSLLIFYLFPIGLASLL